MSDSIAAAREWLAAVLAGEAHAMWIGLDADYRRVLVRRWAQGSVEAADVDALVDRFAADACEGEPWPLYLELERRSLLLVLPKGAASWTWPRRAELVPPDCELVKLYDDSAIPPAPRPRSLVLPAVRFYMRHDGERWLVAGVDEAPSEWATATSG